MKLQSVDIEDYLRDLAEADAFTLDLARELQRLSFLGKPYQPEKMKANYAAFTPAPVYLTQAINLIKHDSHRKAVISLLGCIPNG